MSVVKSIIVSRLKCLPPLHCLRCRGIRLFLFTAKALICKKVGMKPVSWIHIVRTKKWFWLASVIRGTVVKPFFFLVLLPSRIRESKKPSMAHGFNPEVGVPGTHVNSSIKTAHSRVQGSLLGDRSPLAQEGGVEVSRQKYRAHCIYTLWPENVTVWRQLLSFPYMALDKIQIKYIIQFNHLKVTDFCISSSVTMLAKKLFRSKTDTNINNVSIFCGSTW